MSWASTKVLRAVTAVLMVAALLAVSGPTAHAQRPGSLELINQRAWIKPGNLFSLTLSMQGGSGDHLISARVLPAIESRSEFQLHKDGLAPAEEPVFTLEPTPVKQVRTGPNIPAGIILEIETTNPTRSGNDDEPDPSRGLIAEPGVYPVLVTLADPSERQQDEILTFLVITPTSVEGLPELLVNVTLPIQAAPALEPDQSSNLDPESRERIEAVVSEIVSRPSVQVTLAAVPETIMALDRAEESDAVMTDLRTTVEKRELLRLPYVSVDEEAWRNANMNQAYLRLLRAGDRVVQRELASDSQSTAVYLDSTATPSTLSMLADIGYTNFVVSDRLLRSLPSADFPFTVANQFVLEDDDGTLHPAATLDSELSRHFGANENPILDAYYFVADLAALWFDQPAAASRGVIVRPSADWNFNPSVLNVALSGIKAMPITKATTLDNFFERVEGLNPGGQLDSSTTDEPVTRTLVPADDPESLTDYRSRLQQSQGLLSSYERLFGGRTAVSAPLRELLLVSGSRTHSRIEQFEYLQSVTDSINSVKRAITGPTPQVVSITARNADIPLTIESELDTPAQVVVRFTSDKLEFPDGNTVAATLEPNTITNISIPIRSRSSGDAKLRVTVLSPDETIQLDAPTQLIVRSTVFSGLGIIILVGALVILAIWWFRQARRARREKAEAQLAA